VFVGLVAALVLGIGATAIDLGLPGQVLAVAVGGALAGWRATAAGAFHGAVVGAIWIFVFSAISAPNGPEEGILVDTAEAVIADVLYLSAAAGGGWLAGRRR
jgi:hypothetical protein